MATPRPHCWLTALTRANMLTQVILGGGKPPPPTCGYATSSETLAGARRRRPAGGGGGLAGWRPNTSGRSASEPKHGYMPSSAKSPKSNVSNPEERKHNIVVWCFNPWGKHRTLCDGTWANFTPGDGGGGGDEALNTYPKHTHTDTHRRPGRWTEATQRPHNPCKAPELHLSSFRVIQILCHSHASQVPPACNSRPRGRF